MPVAAPQAEDLQWVDHGVSPPHWVPGDPQLAAQYLADALGHPVYERWTWRRLVQAYGALPDARRAKPKVCGLLIEVPAVTEFWQRGKLLTLDSPSAPDVESIVLALLKSNKKRFRLAQSGCALAPTADVPSPIEGQTAMPPSMVGWLQRTGRLFNPHQQTNTLGAADDYTALTLFLNERAARSAHTWRAYVTELGRLVNWCAEYAIGPLSDMTRADLLRYQAQLKSGAAQVASSKAATPRALGEKSQARALAVVSSLFEYWHNTGYLQGNPAAGLTSGARAQAGFAPKRFVPTHLLQRCDDWVAQSVAANPGLREWRRAAIWTVFRTSGARLAELAWNPTEKMPRLENDATNGTVLTVLGKGNKLRLIPLPSMTTPVLEAYRHARGLTWPISSMEEVPLFHGDKGGALGARGLYDEVRAILEAVAVELQDTEPPSADLLRTVSPHWLRHAYARTLVVDERVPLPAAQALLGHASVQTTAAYAKTDLRQLRDFVETGFSMHVPP